MQLVADDVGCFRPFCRGLLAYDRCLPGLLVRCENLCSECTQRDALPVRIQCDHRDTVAKISVHIPVQDTWLGRVLNNFRYFEVSHISMFFVFYAVLLVHPVPGLPGRDNGDRRSVTWVRHAVLESQDQPPDTKQV